MKTSKTKINSNQDGFAALVIAIVLVLVLSLITVGFAELMRNEERSALDKHLSSQAYYAAETGVNDAAKAINAGFASPKPDCGPLPITNTEVGANFLRNNNVGKAADGVSYTCLLVDPYPSSLEYGGIDDAESKIVILSGTKPGAPTEPELISSLVIGWQDNTGNDNFAPSGSTIFKPAADSDDNWSYPTVLRVGMTPLVSGGIGRNSLINSTFAAFLYPNKSASATSPATLPGNPAANSTGALGGKILDGKCNTSSTPRYCNVKVSNINQVSLLLSLRSVYGKSRVTIQAYNSDDKRLRIKDAQTVVDSTGKAQDVLRRVQTRIPNHENYEHTDFGIEATGNICKQLELVPQPGGTHNNCTP